MNRFSSSGRGGGPRFYNSTYPRYTQPLSDSEDTSSTHSVRVSRLIEKIKSQQQRGTGGYVPPSDGFNYFSERGGGRDELIYSRVERGKDERKGTVRERFSGGRDSTPLHKTTVLLNNDDSGGDNSGDYYKTLYSNRYTGGGRGGVTGARYFGEITDYEDDRRISRLERENQYAREEDRKFGTLLRGSSGAAHHAQQHNQQQHQHHHQQTTSSRNSVPKIILHEEAVAEIPNGRVGTRSPSVNRDVTTDEEVERGNSKGSRFLGGLLTLKRGKKGVSGGSSSGTIRSATRSPSTRRTASYLNVPSGSHNRNSLSGDQANDSSSSPKYYVPYHRSTPTLYESKYERDRMSSAAGSVLSNGSYMNKHVSRSMSMKAPWEPRHRVNEIDYYQDSYRGSSGPGPVPADKPVKRTNLSRSKSMPGKKLTSLIGSWVSKGTLKKQNVKDDKHKIVEEDHERLLSKNQAPEQKGKWGTLLRFGKGKKNTDRNNQNGGDGGRQSPERPLRGRKVGEVDTHDRRRSEYSRGSESPVRGGGTLVRGGYNERSGTLLRNSTFERNQKQRGVGGGRGFY